MGNQDGTTPKHGPLLFVMRDSHVQRCPLSAGPGRIHTPPSQRGPSPQLSGSTELQGAGRGLHPLMRAHPSGYSVGSRGDQRGSRGFWGDPPRIPLHTCAIRGPPASPLVCSSRSSHRARAAPLGCSSRSSQRARAAPLVCSSRSSQRARAAQCTHFPEVAATAAERPRSPFPPGFPRAPPGPSRFPQHVL